MVLSLTYGRLENAVSSMNKLDRELENYCDDLSRKVQQKMYDVEGGMSSALNSADYYVKAKIKKLRARAENARDLSVKTQALLTTAKRVDGEVKKMIENNRNKLFDNNSHLKPSAYKTALVAFWSGLKKIPVLGFLLKIKEDEFKAITILINNIRHWYECGGGKELIGIVLSVAATVLAVVLLVLACIFTGGGILAIVLFVMGIIGAIIATVNAVTNVVTSVQAYNAATGGHPGRASILSGRDKLSDVLREENFHNGGWNRASNSAATAIDITETVCDVVDLIDGLTTAMKNIKSLKKLIKEICQPRDGKWTFVQIKDTFLKGIKSISMKFDLKSMLLGDFNVDTLKGLDDVKDAVKSLKGFKDGTGIQEALKNLKSAGNLEKLAKAASDAIENLSDVNSGERTFAQFIGSRITSGIYENLGKTDAIERVSELINKIGLIKFITDLDKSGALSFINNSEEGFIQSLEDVLETLSKHPRRFAFDKVFEINVSPPKLNYTLINIQIPKIVLPPLNIFTRFELQYPYYNVV